MSSHPYDLLTPDVVLDALAHIGLPGDGRLTALNSYENRVYLAHLEDGRAVVAKFYRPGRWTDAQIEEEHALALALAAAEVPVVPPLDAHGRTLHHHAGFAFSVSPWRGGRPPEWEDLDVLAWIGRFLARLHRVGERAVFRHRPALTPQHFGHESVAWLRAHEAIPAEARAAWLAAAETALEVVDAIWSRTPFTPLRLHGDCHPGNILWTPTERPGGGPHFVDLDDARAGAAVQDLWMLLSGDRAQRQRQLGALLDGYETMRPFDRCELALIEPLRTLRLIHYSAWLARRWSDPTFPRHFPWFGRSDYWLEQARTLHEQVAAMEDEPLVA
jgi:Ser/Thr protein kinase RdoA (MazF antagonist)